MKTHSSVAAAILSALNGQEVFLSQIPTDITTTKGLSIMVF